MNHQPIKSIKSKPHKPYEKFIWVINSTAVLFTVFWLICLMENVVVWAVGNAVGMPVALSFDKMVLRSEATWSSSQVIITYGAVPIFLLLVALISHWLYAKYRLKKDLRKLFFLWMEYTALGIFGGNFVTSYIDRGSMSILWEYMTLNTDFMPVVAFLMAALLIFFGIFNFWKFLNISPSAEINKMAPKRIHYILCVLIIPALILFSFGFMVYPHLEITSRLYSAGMIWVPIISGAIPALASDSILSKVPAFKDSDISKFQLLYFVGAILVYIAVISISI